MLERLKKIPVPIWIGLGLVLIVIFLMNGSKSKSSDNAPAQTAPVGPVTTATVGTQGAQSGAGTDQQLGNLSVMTQSGFAQIAQQQQAILDGMNGHGTTMQQFGHSMQRVQNGSARENAIGGTPGQNAGSDPTTVTAWV